VGNASDDALSHEVRTQIRFFRITITDKDPVFYESEISRLNFLARLKPAKVESHLIEQLDK